MKVLWLINAPIPKISEAMGQPGKVKEGWIAGLFDTIGDKVDYVIVFPQFDSVDTVEGTVGKCRFYGFYKESDKPYLYNPKVEDRLKAILEKEKPDVVHIAGTEYDHAPAMTKVFGHPERTVVSIQGLTSVYARHYMANLPHKVQVGRTFRDFVKHDNLEDDRKKYVLRGKMETETIENSGNVIGRTEWDKACTYLINPKAKYFHCGEILRSSFYDGARWEYDKCEKHSIFVSQGYYPIKGLHYMLEAVKDIKRFYPDVRLYVAGGVTLNEQGFKNRLKQKNYQRYLAKLLDEFNIRQNVTFLPALGEKEMKAQYLKSNIFVSPSSIENSPNSLGEAMILGVPCVSSHVGGVADMLVHNEEGFIYQHDAPYMLAHYCMDIFRMQDENAGELIQMTDRAAAHAQVLFSKEINGNTMIDIYKEIAKEN